MAFSKETLIFEVQRRPALWQDTNKNFKKKSVTDKLWDDVGNACGLPGSVAKLKWKNLKDQFRRENQKLPILKSGSTPRWQYFQRLLFLKDIMSPSNDSVSHDRRENDAHDDEDSDGENGYGDKESVRSSSMLNSMSVHLSQAPTLPRKRSRSSSQMSESRSSTSANRKRKPATFIEEFLELHQKKVPLLQKDVHTPDKGADSADLHFFKSLLPYMESFSLLEKLELRTRIQQLVLNKFTEVSIRQFPQLKQ